MKDKPVPISRLPELSGLPIEIFADLFSLGAFERVGSGPGPIFVSRPSVYQFLWDLEYLPGHPLRLWRVIWAKRL